MFGLNLVTIGFVMHKFLFVILGGLLLTSCNKDKYTTAPQLKFKKFSPSVATRATVDGSNLVVPYVIFEITDKEGDIGFKKNVDTSKIYLKNPATGRIDSLQMFPDFSAVTGNNTLVTAEVPIKAVLPGINTTRPRPYTDTVRLEVTITDFEGNKSNVMYTSDPFIYITE